jgi:hypothetical protein
MGFNRQGEGGMAKADAGNLNDIAYEDRDGLRLTPPVSAGRRVGPAMQELAQLAQAAARLETSVDLDLEDGHVTLTVVGWRHSGGYSIAANACHCRERHTHSSNLPTTTFEQAMVDLVNQWFTGRLKPDSIRASGSKCRLRGRALRELATAAWCEAFGLRPPSADKTDAAR